MEFVKDIELADLYRELGITEDAQGEECIYLRMMDSDERAEYHLTSGANSVAPANGARVVTAKLDTLAGTIEHVIYRLHLAQIVLVPVGKWRNVFDAIAFSMASNEDWQEIDAAATVELNTRDPLLCDASDFPLLIELVNALLNDAESPEQGLYMLTGGVPLLIEVIPNGAVNISIGSPQVADEIDDIVSPA